LLLFDSLVFSFPKLSALYLQGVNLITSGHFYLGESGHYYFALTRFIGFIDISKLMGDPEQLNLNHTISSEKI
jgi:hypothetical protein